MKESAVKLADYADKRYTGAPIRKATGWQIGRLKVEQRFTYRIVNNALENPTEDASFYREYLSLYEADTRAELDMSGLACTRFRRHRVRCFYGTGGKSWRDGSLPESSSLRRCG